MYMHWLIVIDKEVSCGHFCHIFKNEGALISHWNKKNTKCFVNFSSHLAGTSNLNQTLHDDGNCLRVIHVLLNYPLEQQTSLKSSRMFKMEFSFINRPKTKVQVPLDWMTITLQLMVVMPYLMTLLIRTLQYSLFTMIVPVVCFHCGQHVIIEASESVHATQSPALFFEILGLWCLVLLCYISCGSSCEAKVHRWSLSMIVMEKLRTFPKFVKLFDWSCKAVYCFPFVNHVNCLFSFDNPFSIQEDNGIRANVNRPQFWHQIQKEMCAGPSDFLSLLVLFFIAPQLTCMVKSVLSPHDDWWLVQASVCTKAHAWREIGLLPKLKVKSSTQNKASSKCSPQEYHTVLSAIFISSAQ